MSNQKMQQKMKRSGMASGMTTARSSKLRYQHEKTLQGKLSTKVFK